MASSPMVRLSEKDKKFLDKMKEKHKFKTRKEAFKKVRKEWESLSLDEQKKRAKRKDPFFG